MKSKLLVSSALALAMTLGAHAQGKVAVIAIQQAIAATRDGQKAVQELEAKTAPKQKEISQKQNDISALQDQLNKGQNTLSDSAKNDLYKNIETKKKTLQREIEDAQAELEQDQQKLLQALGQRIVAVIERYAKDNGYTMVVDVGSPQTPVLYASPSIDITKEIIELYDKSAATLSAPAAPKTSSPAQPALSNPPPAAAPRPPATGAPPAAAPASKPPVTTPPPTKKQ